MNNNLSARRSHRWLSREQRTEVKNLLLAGSRAEELAVKFDVHFNTIRNIGKEQSVTTPLYQVGHIAPNGPISKNPGTEEKDSGASPCDAGAGGEQAADPATRQSKIGSGGSGNQANRDPHQSKTNSPIEESKNRVIEESVTQALRIEYCALSTPQSPTEEPRNQKPKTNELSPALRTEYRALRTKETNEVSQ